MAILQIPQPQSKTIVNPVNFYVYTYADAYANTNTNTK